MLKITLDILNLYFIFFHSLDQAHCISAINQMGLLFWSVHAHPWEFNVAAAAI